MNRKKHSLSGRYKRFFINEHTALVAAVVSVLILPVIYFFGTRSGGLNLAGRYDLLLRFLLVATLFYSLKTHKLFLMQAATVGLLFCMLCAQSQYALDDLASRASRLLPCLCRQPMAPHPDALAMLISLGAEPCAPPAMTGAGPCRSLLAGAGRCLPKAARGWPGGHGRRRQRILPALVQGTLFCLSIRCLGPFTAAWRAGSCPAGRAHALQPAHPGMRRRRGPIRRASAL